MVQAVERWWYPTVIVVPAFAAFVYWSTRASDRMMLVVGALFSACGAVGLAVGLNYLLGALAPENRSNELRELGVALGIAAVTLSAVLGLGGLGLVVAGMRRRRHTETSVTTKG